LSKVLAGLADRSAHACAPVHDTGHAVECQTDRCRNDDVAARES